MVPKPPAETRAADPSEDRMDISAALIGTALGKDGRFSAALRARRIVEAVLFQGRPPSGVLCAFDAAQFNFFAPNAGYPEAFWIASEVAERLACGLRRPFRAHPPCASSLPHRLL